MMLHQNGVPAAADSATTTATTNATDSSSFVENGQELIKFDLLNQPVPPKSPLFYIHHGTKHPKNQIITFLCSKGAPTAADGAQETASTRAPNHPSFVDIGEKLNKPGHHEKSYYATLSAIARLRGPQNTSNVEPYVENW